MNRRNWLDHLFSLSLHLYPREFRQQFGEEMREVFRQQCQNQQSRLRLFAGLLLDNLRAVPAEHGRVFAQQGLARTHTLLLLTMISAFSFGFVIYRAGGIMNAASITQQVATGVASDLGNAPLVFAIKASNEHRYHRAMQMLDSPDRKEQLTAALLLTESKAITWNGKYRPTPNSELDARIAEIINEVGIASIDSMELQLAAQACIEQLHCSAESITARLITLDANNAVSWLYHAEALREQDPDEAVAALRRASQASGYNSIGALPLRIWLEAVLKDPFEPSWWQSGDVRLQDWAETPSDLMSIGLVPRVACREFESASEPCAELAHRWRLGADSVLERSYWFRLFYQAMEDDAFIAERKKALSRYQRSVLALDEALLANELKMTDILESLQHTNDLSVLAEEVMAVAPCIDHRACGKPDLPWPILPVHQMARPVRPVN